MSFSWYPQMVQARKAREGAQMENAFAAPIQGYIQARQIAEAQAARQAEEQMRAGYLQLQQRQQQQAEAERNRNYELSLAQAGVTTPGMRPELGQVAGMAKRNTALGEFLNREKMVSAGIEPPAFAFSEGGMPTLEGMSGLLGTGIRARAVRMREDEGRTAASLKAAQDLANAKAQEAERLANAERERAYAKKLGQDPAVVAEETAAGKKRGEFNAIAEFLKTQRAVTIPNLGGGLMRQPVTVPGVFSPEEVIRFGQGGKGAAYRDPIAKEKALKEWFDTDIRPKMAAAGRTPDQIEQYLAGLLNTTMKVDPEGMTMTQRLALANTMFRGALANMDESDPAALEKVRVGVFAALGMDSNGNMLGGVTPPPGETGEEPPPGGGQPMTLAQAKAQAIREGTLQNLPQQMRIALMDSGDPEIDALTLK